MSDGVLKLNDVKFGKSLDVQLIAGSCLSFSYEPVDSKESMHSIITVDDACTLIEFILSGSDLSEDKNDPRKKLIQRLKDTQIINIGGEKDRIVFYDKKWVNDKPLFSKKDFVGILEYLENNNNFDNFSVESKDFFSKVKEFYLSEKFKYIISRIKEVDFFSSKNIDFDITHNYFFDGKSPIDKIHFFNIKRFEFVDCLMSCIFMNLDRVKIDEYYLQKSIFNLSIFGINITLFPNLNLSVQKILK